MLEENQGSHKIEQMRQFYEIFPYPSRPFFMTPLLSRHMSAHGAFSALIAQNQIAAAHEILKNDLSPKYKKKIKGKKAFVKLEKIFPSSKKILLVGCGTDEPLLFRILHPQNAIVCVELSRKNIKIAKRKLSLYSLFNWYKFMFYKQNKTEFIVGDANIILKQKFIGEFDYIQCFGVLHHQPDPELLLSGLAQRLKIGGTLRMMIYSYYGRSLERKIQKRYTHIWQNISKLNKLKLLIFYSFLILRVWQLFNFLGLKKSTSLRFKYLGLNSKFVADALMHPSDPGLCLEDILPMAEKNNLRLIYCQAKIENQGLVYGLQDPLGVWDKILQADKKQALLSNPIIIFTRVDS